MTKLGLAMEVIFSSVFVLSLVVAVPTLPKQDDPKHNQIDPNPSQINNNPIFKEIANGEIGPYPGRNPEELGGYYEGDIKDFDVDFRNGLRNKTAKWPGGVIPYEIAGNFNKSEIKLINKAIAAIRNATCIKLRIKTDADPDYISIINHKIGCWSALGRQVGRQELNLQRPGCVDKVGTPIHEIVHAIGFAHEQSRMDRETYVEILRKNIHPRDIRQFEIIYETDTFGVPYDYGSVMHYPWNAFAIDTRFPTIIAKIGNPVLGQRERLSHNDILKINMMYDCRKKH